MDPDWVRFDWRVRKDDVPSGLKRKGNRRVHVDVCTGMRANMRHLQRKKRRNNTWKVWMGLALAMGGTLLLAFVSKGSLKRTVPQGQGPVQRCPRTPRNANRDGVAMKRTNLMDVEIVTLSDGWKMPTVGFGTAGLGVHTQQAVEWALEAGYRHIDSAQARAWYREDLVGKALQKQKGRIAREDVFLTSKLHPLHFGYNAAIAQFQRSLQELNTTYLDLFLLHYPNCTPKLCGDATPTGTWKDTWRALGDLHRQGRIRSLGVSNFSPHQMMELLNFAEVCPVVLQAYSDPMSNNVELQDLCAREGIWFVAYSSFGIQWILRGAKTNPVLESPVIRRIAERNNCSTGGAVIAWAHAQGQVVIPRSSKRERIRANFQEKCKLTDQDVQEINALNKRGA